MIDQRRTPTSSEAPNARDSSIRQGELLAIKDQEVASNEEMGESPREVDVPSPPLAAEVPVEGTDEEMYETERQLPSEDRRRKLVERHIEEYDIPESLKRQKYEESPSGASRVAQLVLNEIFNPGQGEWLDPHALSGVSALTGKVVRAGRVHEQPRKNLYDCRSHRKANRLSVMSDGVRPEGKGGDPGSAGARRE